MGVVPFDRMRVLGRLCIFPYLLLPPFGNLCARKKKVSLIWQEFPLEFAQNSLEETLLLLLLRLCLLGRSSGRINVDVIISIGFALNTVHTELLGEVSRGCPLGGSGNPVYSDWTLCYGVSGGLI